MNNLSQSVTSLQSLIQEGKTIEAMERFYAENVTMQENNDALRVGKAVCIAHESASLARVKAMQGTLKNYAINEETGRVFQEWTYQFTNHKDQTFTLNEVSLQTWENDQIVSERFFYKEFLT